MKKMTTALTIFTLFFGLENSYAHDSLRVSYVFDGQIGKGYDNLDYTLAQLSPSLAVPLSTNIFVSMGVRLSIIESKVDGYERRISGSGLQPFVMLGLKRKSFSMEAGLGYEFLKYSLVYEGDKKIAKSTSPFIQTTLRLKLTRNLCAVATGLYGEEMFSGGTWKKSTRVSIGLGIRIGSNHSLERQISQAGMFHTSLCSFKEKRNIFFAMDI